MKNCAPRGIRIPNEHRAAHWLSLRSPNAVSSFLTLHSSFNKFFI